MHSWRRSVWRSRPKAALLTLAAHALFAALLLLGSRFPARPPVVVAEVRNIPITLLPLPVTPAAPLDEQPPETDEVPARAGPPPAPSPRPLETAITLPAPAAEAPLAVTDQPGNVDWFGQSVEFAARYAEELDAPAPGIGKPVAKMREPCKPRESSFKWQSDSRSTGSGSLTLGWEEPEPNKHLFDDMMAGRRSKSSVPDPNVCD